MPAAVRSLITAWDRFFFGKTAKFPLAVFRIVFALNIIVLDAVRFADWRFYFTDEGFVPASQAMAILPEFFRPVISWYPTTPGAAFAGQILLLLSLTLLALGVLGRLAALVAFLLHLAFMQRNFSVVYGADLITTFFLFGLIFADSSAELSLSAWYRRRKGCGPRGPISEIFSTVGLRLMQIQLCVVYGFTGLEKLKGPSWWDGTAVWSVLGNKQLMMFDTTWLRHMPLVIAGMTMGTVLFEIYFPVLVWLKPVRKWLLLFGVIVHSSIAVTVGLYFFSINMMSIYLLFIEEQALRKFFAKIARRFGSR